MADVIQIRRDTAANWTSADPTLAQGELGYETDTSKLKIGDGSTAWTSLDYAPAVQTAQLADESVTLAKLAHMATASLLGRSTAGTGDPEVLSASAARTLLNVEDGATADQSNAEIETAYNAQVSVVGQSEAEAGTATTVRRWTAERVGQAIAALASAVAQASQSAVEAESDVDEYVPPDKLRYAPSAAKFWAKFDGTGTIAIDASYNVVSLTDVGTGNYMVNIDDDFSTAQYALAGGAALSGSRAYIDFASSASNAAGSAAAITANQSGTLIDADMVCLVGYGDQ